MAILPDLDLFLAPLQKITKSYYLGHRAGSHSYIIGIIIAFIGALILSVFYSVSFLTAWLIGSLFYGIHVSLDLITTSQIPIFYPLSKREYRFPADRAVNPLLALSSFTGFHLLFLFSRILKGIHPIFNPVNILISFYLIYFSYRMITRGGVQSHLPDNAQYIPGILPFVYTIYESNKDDNNLHFKLSKKIQFKAEAKPIVEIHLKKEDLEWNFFNRANELTKDYRFFSKWKGLIPIFKETEAIFKVRLFLAESMTKRFGYCLTVDFDKKNGEILKKFDRFKPIKSLS